MSFDLIPRARALAMSPFRKAGPPATVILLVLSLALLAAPRAAEALTSISTCSQLQDMQNNLAESYVLSGNIDCTGFDPNVDGSGFVPVGSLATPFAGSFNGAGFSISGLTINRPATQRVGLFGYVNGGTYQNVTISGSIEGLRRVGSLIGASDAAYNLTVTGVRSSVSVTGHGSIAGGLVGYGGQAVSFSDSSYSGTLTNSSDAADVSNLGGIIGYADGTLSISSSTVSGTLIASTTDGIASDIGGLVGYVFDSAIVSSSTVSGDLTVIAQSASNIGGLIGDAIASADIDGGYVTGNIVVRSVLSSSAVGGLVGFPSGSGDIAGSKATGNLAVTAGTDVLSGVGGLVGYNSGILPISDSFKTGNISVIAGGSVSDGVGGIIGGYFNGSLSRSYAYGNISVQAAGNIGTGVGGLVGYVGAAISSSNNFFSGNIHATSTAGSISGIGGIIGYVDNNASTISSSYSNASIVLKSSGTTGFVGGMMGNSTGFGSIANSFSASPISVSATGGSSDVGAFIGNDGGGTLTNDFYDRTLSTLSFCVGSGDPSGCTAIVSNSSYFKGSDSNPPLDSWNFSSIWKKANGQYPSLRALASPYGTPDPDPTPTPDPAPASSSSAGSTIAVQTGGSGPNLSAAELAVIFGYKTAPAVPASSGGNSCPASGVLSAHAFSRDLKVGSFGNDVRALQCFLNAYGFSVALAGPGSAGRETLTFGLATRAALARFQKASGVSPAVGFFGPVTRAAVKARVGAR